MKDKKFDERNKKFEKTMSKDVEFKKLSQRWFDISLTKYEYPYHFTWLGRPIIQYPQDILIIQECEKLKQDYFPNAQYFWTGRDENKGLAVLIKKDTASISKLHNQNFDWNIVQDLLLHYLV